MCSGLHTPSVGVHVGHCQQGRREVGDAAGCLKVPRVRCPTRFTSRPSGEVCEATVEPAAFR